MNIKCKFIFVLIMILIGEISLDAKNTSQSDLKKEVNALAKQLESTKTDLAALRKEVQSLKNQKNITSIECIEKLEEQQRKLSDTKEIEHVLIKFGNNQDGLPALHYAAKVGNVEAVTLLIANGADVNSATVSYPRSTSQTALGRAAGSNQLEVVKVLLNFGADVNFTPYEDSLYPICYAAEKGSGELVTFLMENGAILDKTKPNDNPKNRRTPLHLAAKAGNYDAVVAFVKGGIDVDAINKEIGEGTPLDAALRTLTYKDNPKNLELVKFLVEHGFIQHDWDNEVCPVIRSYMRSIRK